MAQMKKKKTPQPAQRRNGLWNATKMLMAVGAGGGIGAGSSMVLAYMGLNPYAVGTGVAVAGAVGTYAMTGTAKLFSAGVVAGGIGFDAYTAINAKAAKSVLGKVLLPERKAATGSAYLGAAPVRNAIGDDAADAFDEARAALEADAEDELYEEVA